MSIIFENENFRLAIGENAVAESLFCKASGEECLLPGASLPIFSLMEKRPFNNEIKLAYMNKKTVFSANRVRRDGDKLIVGFELVHFEAVVEVLVRPEYMCFTLVDFIADPKNFPTPMDIPPVESFRLLQLPLSDSHPYGQWINVCHTEKSKVAVMASAPETLVTSECIAGMRILTADTEREIKLKNTGAVLIVTENDKEVFLDAIDKMESDFGLPRGVKSRRDPRISSSIYWTMDLNPKNVDKHIKYAKMGGFKLMLVYYTSMFKEQGCYNLCGDCDFTEDYPRGLDDLRDVVSKVKAAGITPGMHFLHTHVGIESRYVTPKVDYRLNLKEKFTLARELSEGDDVIYVEENPITAPKADKCRFLRFGTEAISYEGYTTEPPYAFTGCKRGALNTEVCASPRGLIGGVLDITEYSGTSIYLNQNTDLQDEIGGKIAEAFNCGFEFIYFDGSEGTNAPYEYHIPNAQYRMYKKMNTAPIFCEGAAKAHFGWHMLSGGNAFDAFPTKIFKDMIIAHPFTEAEFMQRDYTRVNFGWWAFNETIRADHYEFGKAKAAAWDCPATVMARTNCQLFDAHPRCADIFEVLRRWEDVVDRRWLTEEQKKMLKEADKEHILLINESGEYELVEYEDVKPESPDGRFSAFTFSRGGAAYAVIWDNLGESELEIDASAVESYVSELGGEPITYPVSNNLANLPLGARKYIKSSLSVAELRAALAAAKIK